MSINKLSLLPAGRCKVDASILDTRIQPGQSSVILPIWVYLLETSDGPVLIDTGMPASCAAEPTGLFGGLDDGSIVPEMTEEDQVLNILSRNGYKPGDLACVVSSHLHFDHAGGNALFPETEIVVQRKEYEAAQVQPGYFDVCRRPDLKYKLIDGDTELLPGLQLLSTPGHSAGHQSVLVRTKGSGNILLTIDTAYTRNNFEDNVPFAVYSQSESDASIARLKDIAKSENAEVFYGHDIQQEKEWANRLVIY